MTGGRGNQRIDGYPSAGVLAASDNPDRGRAGFKCCRRCDRSTKQCHSNKTTVFREIPAGSMFFGAGLYWRGPDSNGDVWGSGHANSRFLCNEHDKIRQKQEALAETSVHLLHATPRLLPPDHFCGVCARLVVNQDNGLETEQVATMCCGFMCGHCAAEQFIASLQHGMHCNTCSSEVLG